jgi:AcrR family transcriptional regulator
VNALCSQLAISRGCFYRHFRGVDDFARALAVHWESSRLDALEGQFGLVNPSERLRALIRDIAGASSVEAGLGRWGLEADPTLALIHARVDRATEWALREALLRLVEDPARARLGSECAIALLVGLRSLHWSPHTDLLTRLLTRVIGATCRPDTECDEGPMATGGASRLGGCRHDAGLGGYGVLSH